MKTIREWALGITLAVSILPVGNTAIAEFSNEGVIHTVFLWLKKPGDVQHRRQLLIASDRLRSIEGVLDIRFGEMIESNRDIVDDSFDVGIYFSFQRCCGHGPLPGAPPAPGDCGAGYYTSGGAYRRA